MAHFYGTLRGNRGEASRLGTKASGLHTYAASWEGAVSVYLRVGDDGKDYAYVCLTKHRNEGAERVLYNGPVDGTLCPGAEACQEACNNG